MHSEKGKAHRTKEPEVKQKITAEKSSSVNRKGRVIKFSENNQSPAHNKAEDKPAEGKLASGIVPEDIVFALDIGTRTVVGVTGVQEDGCFRVIATEIVEHRNRAMLDGQIHDIEQVAAAAAQVRDKLENRLGVKLKKVAIAAAGRVLKTCQVRVDKNLEQGREIDAEFVRSLEIVGIQRAQINLDEESAGEDKTQFYCVGYSVINYYLNGYVISNLIGHKGKNVGADILATFLPLIVVDSLYTVMNKIGLEVSSLTLEPIAAINVTIPADLRLLNLALVDIGAGTSDIALTKDGSVIAYAMVPFAGDEITEMISQHYLVDFNTGEKIKIALSSNKEKITFTDILKIRRSVSSDEVLKSIGETVQQLAATIAQKILEYNHKAPNAVFLVGGGSRIPGLSEIIAHLMELPPDRVVVRGRDVIRDIKFSDKKLYGPESITPYGIAITSQMYGGKDFMTVNVNERKIKLFNAKKLTVADALILYGFDAGRLIGRTGKSVSYTVNGEKKIKRGEYGKAADIYVNEKPASIDTSISFGDNIRAVPSEDGKDASVSAYELIPSSRNSGTVKLNGNPVDISAVILINGRQITENVKINSGDEILISQIVTLKDLLDAGGLEANDCILNVNDSDECSMDYHLKDGDMVNCYKKKEKQESLWRDILIQEEPGVTDTDELIREQGKVEKAALSEKTGEIGQSGQNNQSGLTEPARQPGQYPTESSQAGNMQVTVNGRSVQLKDDRKQYIFVDIFNYIDFDLTKPQGTIVLRLNGQQAAFTDVIKSGDVIEIFWKNQG